jgi:hypothetical protein
MRLKHYVQSRIVSLSSAIICKIISRIQREGFCGKKQVLYHTYEETSYITKLLTDRCRLARVLFNMGFITHKSQLFKTEFNPQLSKHTRMSQLARVTLHTTTATLNQESTTRVTTGTKTIHVALLFNVLWNATELLLTVD